MKKKRLLTLVGLVLVLVALLLPACAKEEAPAPAAPTPAAKPVVWKWANWGIMSSPFNYLPKWYFDEVEKRSGGRLKVEYFVSESLVPKKEVPEAIKSGLCQGGVFMAGYYPAKMPLTSGLNLPFASPPSSTKEGVRDCYRLVDELYKLPFMKKELADWDAKFIISHGFTQMQWYGNKPVRTVADLKGLKIRGTSALDPVFKHFGAVPVFVASGDFYSSLQTGLVDLISHSIYMFRAYKLYEVSQYFIDDVFLGNNAGAMVIKLSAFEALPDDLQKIMEEAKDEALLHFADGYHEDEVAGRKLCGEHGIEVIQFPPEERAKLVEGGKDIAWEDWATKAEAQGVPARECLDAIVDIMKKLGY